MQCRIGVECLVGRTAAATAGNPARAKAVDGQRHIAPRAYSIRDLRGVAGKAATAVEHDDRGISSDPGGAATDDRRQSGVRPHQVTQLRCRSVIREVGKFDQTSGVSGWSAER
jgi:hypothetical protein